MKVAAINTNVNKTYQKSFRAQPKPQEHSDEYKRQRNNLLKILLPILIGAVTVTVAYFTYKTQIEKIPQRVNTFVKKTFIKLFKK